MPWRGRQHDDDFPSLGWELLDWFSVLPSPRDPSKPLRFTDEQAMQIVEWFAIDPVTSRLVHRRGYSRRSKGWGKSPVEAAKVIAELAGPVRFAGWDTHGEPVGMPWGTPGEALPWVQVGAVSEDQTDNTWSVVYYFLTENDGSAADELRIDAGLTRCFLRDRPGAKLEPVTASAGSREGQPITYACLDETHLWTPRNGGVRLARTMRRNVAKMGGRSYETTNSFTRGELSVAEASFKAVQNGAGGIFADEIEAPTEISGRPISLESSDTDLRKALKVAYGDASWADLDRLIGDIRDPDSPWTDSARFFFNWNQDATEEVRFGPIHPDTWAALYDENSSMLADGARMAVDVAFDRTWTSVGVVGVRPDGHVHVKLGKTIFGSPSSTETTETIAAIAADLGLTTVTIGKGLPGESLGQQLEGAGLTVDSMSKVDQANATAKMIDSSNGEHPTIHHRGERVLAKAVKLAQVRSFSGGGQIWSPSDSDGDISPITAVTMAYGRVGVSDGVEELVAPGYYGS